MSALLAFVLAGTAFGQITNTVTASGSYGPTPVTGQASESITVAPAAPAMSALKSGTLNDDDGIPGVSAGDSITYALTVQNTGNVSLTGVSVADPLVTLTLSGGDVANPGVLDPGETWTYSGSYILTAADISTNGGGDYDIDNTATISSGQLPAVPASAIVPLLPPNTLDLQKTLVSISSPYPNVFDVVYRIAAVNGAPVTLTNITVADNLSAAFAPGVLVGTPTVTLTGFGGTGGANPGFDGNSNTALLQGDVQLASGASGEIQVQARFATSGSTINSVNTAMLTSPQLPGPVPSDDPNVTPGNPADTNPTPFSVVDTDGDGSPDGTESGGSDRDGDGAADSSDYDPTGYFYCEADGRILSGGLITVTNTGTGWSQTGVGSSNSITVVQDGSNGHYQFHVSADGIYRLTYTLPTGGVASTTRLPGATLDVTSFLPANPGVLGSGEFGSSGALANYSAAANPFHVEFAIEAGDPAVFNNNIPLQDCGSPELTVAKAVTAGPTLQSSGQNRIVYTVTVTSSGSEEVENVSATDDLNAAFGAGNFTVESVTLASAPSGFAAAANAAFDGNGNLQLLTPGGVLQPGEAVTLAISVLVNVPAGLYTNTVSASGVSPIDNSALPPVVATADTSIGTTADTSGLFVSKKAGVALVDRGQPVPYTITVENRTATARSGVDVVDLMPAGFTYRAGSARIDAIAQEPLISGRELVFSGVTIPASGSVTLTLSLVPGAAAAGPEFINYAFVRDPASGIVLSNVAEAKVRLRIEPVFDCPDIIGRVFDDANRDGYMQDGEKGVAGVRLATARGLLITTDVEGRFHIACPMVPDASIGSNFIVKLDARTLPQGYSVTSENPRVVRLTRGKLVKLNFGVAGLRLVEFGLDARSFENGSTRLKRTSLAALDRLLNELAAEPARLQIIYAGKAGDALARERAELAASLVRAAWKARGGSYDLSIEAKVQ